MSVADKARVLVFLADYAGVDAVGKINAIGAGFSLMTALPQAGGATAPLCVVVAIDVEPAHLQEEFSVAVELRPGDSDTAVMVPGPIGQPEALRFSQMMRADRPAVGAEFQQPDGLYGRVQVALSFPTGLQLTPGPYRWQVVIDGSAKPEWSAVFHVLAPRTGPIMGGPSTPITPDLPPV